MQPVDPELVAALKAYKRRVGPNRDELGATWRSIERSVARGQDRRLERIHAPPSTSIRAVGLAFALAACVLLGLWCVRFAPSTVHEAGPSSAVNASAVVAPLPRLTSIPRAAAHNPRPRPTPSLAIVVEPTPQAPPLSRRPSPRSAARSVVVDLDAELRLLRRAEQRLRLDDTAGARRWLQRHATEFANGSLVEEREAIAIEIACAEGLHDEARRRLAAFDRRYPDSPYRTRLGTRCDGPTR